MSKWLFKTHGLKFARAHNAIVFTKISLWKESTPPSVQGDAKGRFRAMPNRHLSPNEQELTRTLHKAETSSCLHRLGQAKMPMG